MTSNLDKEILEKQAVLDNLNNQIQQKTQQNNNLDNLLKEKQQQLGKSNYNPENQNQIQEIISPQIKDQDSGPVRIYIDGAFDLIHSGHYNAIRQAKALGDILVMGVNSDEEILKNKGPPVLNCKERAEILRACKWIDEVYEDTEYTVKLETLDRYNCQYYAHGDDAIFDSEGNDICGFLKSKGRFKMFKRTEGVSTTDIVGKLLLLTKDNQTSSGYRKNSFEKPLKSSDFIKEVKKLEQPEEDKESTQSDDWLSSITIPKSQFLATTRRIMIFSNNREPKPKDKVIYISGSFDLLHNGHIRQLKQAKNMGDFLYVGVWSDEIISQYKGSEYPLLSLHERVLMLLACKYVDDVVIGAPYQIQQDLIKSLNIQNVVSCKNNEDDYVQDSNVDPNEVAKNLGIYQEFEVDGGLSIESIADRVVKNRLKYKQKYEKKKNQEDKYYEKEKQYVQEL